MANKYRWSFDSVFVSEPTNALEMVDSINYDEKLKFIYWEKANSFNFIGDAYDYLYSKYTEGFCNEVAVQIDEDCAANGNYTPIFKGIIKIRDIVFEVIKCACRTKVYDNNYFALINNNANIEHLFNIQKTKNDEYLSTTGTFSIGIINPCTFSATHTRQLYRVDRCLNEIIGHITDNRVEYESPFFGTGGDKEWLMCGSGYQFRVDGWYDLFPLLGMKATYETLFSELDKQFNLGVYIDESGTKPKVIIDLYDKLFEINNSIRINNPTVIKFSTFFDKIFSHVKLGGEVYPLFDCPDNGNFPTETAFYGFKREQFTLLSQCNIDKELNLELSYIVDHNILYQVIIGGVENWDSNVFLLDCWNNAGIITPYLTDIFTNNNYYWNDNLRNNNISDRWSNKLPSSMAGYLQQTNYRFKAVRISSAADCQNFNFGSPFEDDYNLGFDPDNIYGNGTAQGFPVSPSNCKMTAPVTGYYLIKYHVDSSFGNIFIDFTVTDLNDIVKYVIPKSSITNSPQSNVDIYVTLYMIAGDKMFTTSAPQTLNDCGNNSYIELLSSPIISGVAQGVTQGDANLLKVEVDTYIPKSEYSLMKANFKKYIEIHSMEKIYRGYIYASKYEEVTTKAQLTLITSNNFLNGRN